jgi:hypothetical protein
MAGNYQISANVTRPIFGSIAGPAGGFLIMTEAAVLAIGGRLMRALANA